MNSKNDGEPAGRSRIETLVRRYRYHIAVPVFLVAVLLTVQIVGFDTLIERFRAFRYVGF